MADSDTRPVAEFFSPADMDKAIRGVDHETGQALTRDECEFYARAVLSTVEPRVRELREENERLRAWKRNEALALTVCADLIAVAERHDDELEIHADDPIIEQARAALARVSGTDLSSPAGKKSTTTSSGSEGGTGVSTERRWLIRKTWRGFPYDTKNAPYDTKGASIIGPDTDNVAVCPESELEQAESRVRQLEEALDRLAQATVVARATPEPLSIEGDWANYHAKWQEVEDALGEATAALSSPEGPEAWG